MAHNDDRATVEGGVTALLDELAQRVETLAPERHDAFRAFLEEGAMRTPSDALREAIKARGLTAYRLAQQSGASVDAIQRFLNGERGLRLETFDKLCAALGLELVEQRGRRRRAPKRREGENDAGVENPGAA